MAAKTFSNLDLLDQCDAFPYPETDPAAYAAIMSTLYTVLIPSTHPDQPPTPIGYLLPSVLTALQTAPSNLAIPFTLDSQARTITLFAPESHWTLESRTSALEALALHWRAEKIFQILQPWRNEPWPVYGPGENELLFTMDRAAIGLLGATRYGVHMIAYVLSPSSPHGLKIWVPTRAATKSNWPGMLDNTVAGGLMAGEDPLECLIREADEEADLPEDLVRERVQAKGTMTYIYIADEGAGGEAGWIYPEVQWVYDLELPESVIPVPKDGEAERFDLWTVEEVKRGLREGRFKPNCALMTLDFFVRRGILREGEEGSYVREIKERCHRVMPFTGPHREWERRWAEEEEAKRIQK